CSPCFSLCASLPFLLFNAPPPTAIHTLSLHDALPIYAFDGRFRQAGPPNRHVLEHQRGDRGGQRRDHGPAGDRVRVVERAEVARSEEHTSELQSRENLVCRLLLEKKKERARSDYTDWH